MHIIRVSDPEWDRILMKPLLVSTRTRDKSTKDFWRSFSCSSTSFCQFPNFGYFSVPPSKVSHLRSSAFTEFSLFMTRANMTLPAQQYCSKMREEQNDREQSGCLFRTNTPPTRRRDSSSHNGHQVLQRCRRDSYRQLWESNFPLQLVNDSCLSLSHSLW